VSGFRLEAAEASVTVSAADGGRLTSLVVGVHELLITEGYGPIQWGSYPLAPFGGRIRGGAFTFDGRSYRLPLNMPPHAIHGTVFDRPWTVLDDTTMAIDLGPDWPFAGRVTQRFAMAPDRLDISLTLEADVTMPAMLGWHPWFRRELTGTEGRPLPASTAVELSFDPGAMYRRDADGIATGAQVRPTPGPWDDCFTDLRADPVLTWPDVLELVIGSSCDHWVVYSEPTYAICVEPQGGPPDAVNHEPSIVEPGVPMSATMSLRWRRLG
jgi:aldose 1-epimerase